MQEEKEKKKKKTQVFKSGAHSILNPKFGSKCTSIKWFHDKYLNVYM